MNPLAQSDRTFGLRVLPGANSLAARVALDFEQKLFRRNYRRPVLVAASLASERAECERWIAAGAARIFGRDLAARCLNRAAAEAAEPLFLQAIVHGPAGAARDEICRGLADACYEADCAFLDDPGEEKQQQKKQHPPAMLGASKEKEKETEKETATATTTGQRQALPLREEETTTAQGLSVAVAVTAVVERSRLPNLRRADPGDVVLALGGDRLWPDTLEAAKKALATFKADRPLPGLDYAPELALVQPAPNLIAHVQHVLRRYTVKHVVHAMTAVEGDGLGPALERLLGGRFAVKPARSRKCFSPLLGLIDECGARPETADEGHRRGIAFLMVVSQPFAAAVAARLRRLGAGAWPLAKLGTTS